MSCFTSATSRFFLLISLFKNIENPSAKHIIIQAQSQKYEQLGYFKAILKTQGILSPSTVVSSDGERSGEVVKVRIEGDLP